MSDLDDLRLRVDDLIEALAEVATDRLRAAVDADEPERVAAVNLDRRLGRARRSLEKASMLLSEPPS
jgi:hypothetical protein